MNVVTSIEMNERAGGKRLPYFTFSFLFFAFMTASVCAMQIPLFRFRVGSEQWNSPVLFFTLFGLGIALGIAFLYLARRLFGVKTNRFLLIIFGLYAVGGVIGALCHGNSFSFTAKLGTVTIDDSNFLVRLESICSSLLAGFSLYAFFAVAPYTRKCKASGFLIAEALVLCASVFLAYSLITEWNDYVKALSDGMFSVEITSFLGQKNVYAYYLLLAMLAEIFLLEIDGHRWRYFMMALFLLTIVFTGSKAAILMAFVAFAFYLVYRLIRAKKEGTFAWKNAVIPFSIIGVGALLLIVVLIRKPNFFASLWEAFVTFFQNGDGSNVNSRLAIWNSSIELVNQSPVYWIFGQGDVIFPYLMSAAMDIPGIGTAHNAVLEILGRGGLLRVALFIAFFAYVVAAYVRKAKRNGIPYTVPLALGIIMTARAIIESAFVFDLTYTTLAYSYLILMPILSPSQEELAEKAEEFHFTSAYWKELGRRYGNALIALAVSIVALLIPRPYGWILALVLALASIGLAILLRKKSFFLPLVSLSIANALLIPLSFLGADPLFVASTLLIPFISCLCANAFMYALCLDVSPEWETWENFYQAALCRFDARNRAVIEEK